MGVATITAYTKIAPPLVTMKGQMMAGEMTMGLVVVAEQSVVMEFAIAVKAMML